MLLIKIIKNPFISGVVTGLLLSPYAVSAGLNKWTDEKGQVHYGDRVPSEFLGKEHHLLNEQGVTVRTSKALKTEKELNTEEKKRRLEAEENKQHLIKSRIKALRDRVLLDTFTTEKDLILARDARIIAIDSQISLAETLITHDEKKLASTEKRIKKIEDSGREAPKNLYNEVIAVNRQLENNNTFIKEKTRERVEILSTFEEDVKRFRQLKKQKQEAQERARNARDLD